MMVRVGRGAGSFNSVALERPTYQILASYETYNPVKKSCSLSPSGRVKFGG